MLLTYTDLIELGGLSLVFGSIVLFPISRSRIVDLTSLPQHEGGKTFMRFPIFFIFHCALCIIPSNLHEHTLSLHWEVGYGDSPETSSRDIVKHAESRSIMEIWPYRRSKSLQIDRIDEPFAFPPLSVQKKITFLLNHLPGSENYPELPLFFNTKICNQNTWTLIMDLNLIFGNSRWRIQYDRFFYIDFT